MKTSKQFKGILVRLFLIGMLFFSLQQASALKVLDKIPPSPSYSDFKIKNTTASAQVQAIKKVVTECNKYVAYDKAGCYAQAVKENKTNTRFVDKVCNLLERQTDRKIYASSPSDLKKYRQDCRSGNNDLRNTAFVTLRYSTEKNFTK